jgi:lipopolysaccharide transport system permease protein
MVERKGYGWLLELNPMVWLIDAYRAVLIYGAWPEWLELARFLAVALVVFFLGARFFVLNRRRFADLL